MDRVASSTHLSGAARLAPVMGAVVGIAGMAVLAGWAFDIEALKSVLPGLATMKANTAIGFVLAGTALWLSGARTGRGGLRRRATLARGFAVVLAALGVLTLAEYGFGWDAGIDQLLFRDALVSPGTVVPGRMAPMTALNLTLLAAALLLIDVEFPSGKRPSHWLVLVVCVTSYLAVLGYLYGVSELYAVVAMSSVALHTAVLFVIIGLGVACARPESMFGRQTLADNLASQMNRQLLPVAILVPPILGWLSLRGELAGVYPGQFGLAMFTIGNVGMFSALVWRNARALQLLHDERMLVAKASAWQLAILDSANSSVIATDVDGVIQSVNFEAERNLGYKAEELLGKSPLIFHDSVEVAARAESLTEELGYIVPVGFEVFVAKARRGISDEGDWTYVRRDGSRFPVRLSVTSLRDATGKLTGFLGIGTDITRRKQAEEQLLHLARFDSLTGLANRSHLREILGATMERSERDGRPLAVIYLDVDRFKQINDSFGHLVGDHVLEEFAARLSRAVRTTDTVARLAGDEFVILLELLHQPGDAAAVAEKIAASMREPFRITGLELDVSASMGIALRTPGETDPEVLLRRADAALYQAKASGRGIFAVES